ncbi:MAG: metalloregulator ArsR/SmtB family transcription factor [Acidobacteria bacterium]|nr:metalloregulator ArsR/SmtB family transcription factor [Acidobacteriota bacterium]
MNTKRVLAIADRSNLPRLLEHMTTLADPVRCRVLTLLERHEFTVTELCAVLQLPQSTVSRHLKTLADGGWVVSRRDGTSRYYGLSTSLDQPAARLWPLIREQASETSTAEQDARRAESVLAERRSKSAQFFSSASGQWDHLRAELFGQQFQFDAALAMLDRRLRVGDLGCGTGQLSALLAPYVAQVVAVDASAEMLAAARARLATMANVEVRRGALEALPVDDRQLDIAVLALVLHHVPDPGRAIAEAGRVVQPGGRVLIVDMLPHDRSDYQQQMGHVWLGFAEPQIRRWLESAGFTDVRFDGLPTEATAKGPALFRAVATR